jgi:hypothetical protein
MPNLDPSFRPLEYWKPPKAVRHHIRAKSSAIFSHGGSRHSFTNISEEGEKSLATTTKIADMSYWPKDQHSEGVNLVSRGAPPAYRVDEDTLNPRWYNAREWRKRIWIGLGVVLAIIIIIIVVAVVLVEKANNRYPDYSPLSYSLAETCMYLVASSI